MNADCPVCGAEGAVETDCAKYVEPANEPGQSTDEPEQAADEQEKPAETPVEPTTEEPEQPAEEPEQAAEEQEAPAEPEQLAEPTAVERVQAMLDALPTAEDVAGMDEAYLAAQEAYDALEELTADELAALTGVEALLTVFTDEADTYADDWGIWLGGVNVRKNPKGTEYSYDETNHILTLTNYSTNSTYQHSSFLSAEEGYYQKNQSFIYCDRDYKGTGFDNISGNLVIVLNGTNTLGTKAADSYKYLDTKENLNTVRTCGIFLNGDGLTVQGTGSLTVQSREYAYMGLQYLQKSGTVTMKSAMRGMEVTGNVVVKSGSLTAESVKINMPFLR